MIPLHESVYNQLKNMILFQRLDALPLTFDEKLWHGTIDHVTVHADERVVFHFKDGKEIVTML